MFRVRQFGNDNYSILISNKTVEVGVSLDRVIKRAIEERAGDCLEFLLGIEDGSLYRNSGKDGYMTTNFSKIREITRTIQKYIKRELREQKG